MRAQRCGGTVLAHLGGSDEHVQKHALARVGGIYMDLSLLPYATCDRTVSALLPGLQTC
jgi:hypothetical protein